MHETNQRVAMFIDADNAPSRKVGHILAELASMGAVSIRRAYGNWKSSRLDSWVEVLHEHAIQPVQQFDLVKGKNATDMAMAIDAMDVLYAKQVIIRRHFRSMSNCSTSQKRFMTKLEKVMPSITSAVSTRH